MMLAKGPVFRWMIERARPATRAFIDHPLKCNSWHFVINDFAPEASDCRLRNEQMQLKLGCRTVYHSTAQRKEKVANGVTATRGARVGLDAG